jgi:hypothetical protein
MGFWPFGRKGEGVETATRIVNASPRDGVAIRGKLTVHFAARESKATADVIADQIASLVEAIVREATDKSKVVGHEADVLGELEARLPSNMPPTRSIEIAALHAVVDARMSGEWAAAGRAPSSANVPAAPPSQAGSPPSSSNRLSSANVPAAPPSSTGRLSSANVPAAPPSSAGRPSSANVPAAPPPSSVRRASPPGVPAASARSRDDELDFSLDAIPLDTGRRALQSSTDGSPVDASRIDLHPSSSRSLEIELDDPAPASRPSGPSSKAAWPPAPPSRPSRQDRYLDLDTPVDDGPRGAPASRRAAPADDALAFEDRPSQRLPPLAHERERPSQRMPSVDERPSQRMPAVDERPSQRMPAVDDRRRASDDRPSQRLPAVDERPSQRMPAVDDRRRALDDRPSQRMPAVDDRPSQRHLGSLDLEGPRSSRPASRDDVPRGRAEPGRGSPPPSRGSRAMRAVGRTDELEEGSAPDVIGRAIAGRLRDAAGRLWLGALRAYDLLGVRGLALDACSPADLASLAPTYDGAHGEFEASRAQEIARWKASLGVAPVDRIRAETAVCSTYLAYATMLEADVPQNITLEVLQAACTAAFVHAKSPLGAIGRYMSPAEPTLAEELGAQLAHALGAGFDAASMGWALGAAMTSIEEDLRRTARIVKDASGL